MALSVDIEKKLGNFHLKVKFEAENKVLAILGASGCGKSMTLKCIAGIERPDEGRIVLDGVTLFDAEKKIDLPPQKRRVGYLFQQYALFPNMTVEQNIACGVREKGRKEEAVAEMLRLMELEGMEKKRPHQLSGGQQQRVALARILVNAPEVLLLDEPFSALDTYLRFHLERKVQEIMGRFGKTVLLVSHDRDEAFRLSDSIAVMEQGRIEVVGRKKEVFRDPKTRSGALLTGCKNISRAKIVDDTHVYAVDWDLTLTVPRATVGVEYIGIRMHDIRIAKGMEENRVTCRVIREIEEPFSDTVLLAPVGKGANMQIGIQLDKPVWESIRGEQMTVCLPPDAILLLQA
ncbi:ATP-binding cassette domain-containing protein [Anaerotignum sp.]